MHYPTLHKWKQSVCFSLIAAMLTGLAYLPGSTVFAQSTALRAFPDAEGFGAAAVGGRGGQVIQVTNLLDDGNDVSLLPGSLRACTGASGPRTCVFTVSGRIILAKPLIIKNPFLTIAGQTAPGNGITISAGPTITRGIVIVHAHDVVLRYLGLRPGLNANQSLVEGEYNIDSLTIGDLNVEPYNVIVDHVSMEWSTDEILNTARKHHDITVQWSIMSEVNDCDGDPANNKCGGKGPLFHTGTGDQRGGGDISFHHNLLSSNQGRNPMVKNTGGVNDIVNNVIFPTARGDSAITTILDNTHGDVLVNYVGNYIIGEPSRLNDQRYIDYLGVRMAYPRGTAKYQVYVQGNIGPMRTSDSDPQTWIINPTHVDQKQWNQRGAENLSSTRLPAPVVTTTSAVTAKQQVLAGAGKSRRLGADGSWIAYRDSIDAKVVADVNNGISTQISGQPWPRSLSDWPAGTTTPAYPDADKDGMSDTWETTHGFNTNGMDNNQDVDGDGYTNLEEFLNGTNPKQSGGTSPLPTTSVQASPTVRPTGIQPTTPAGTGTTPCPKAGDTKQGAVCDGNVDILDFAYLVGKFGTTDGSADLNGNGTVDLLDYTFLLQNFGK